jgi:hypothetical protein
MIKLLLGILGVAAVATAGDYAWFELGFGNHRMTAGVIHGAVLLTAVGAVFGLSSGRLLMGLPIGTIAGIGGALTYYAVVGPGRRLMAMVIAWAICWLVLALLDGRLLRRPARSFAEIGGRGLAAAALGGLSFYMMYGTLWGDEGDAQRNYLLQFAAWTVAWAPGILAIAGGAASKGRG